MAPNGVRSQRWPVQRSGPPPVYFADGSGWGSVAAAILVEHTEDENLVGAQTHERFIDDVLDKFSRGGSWRLPVGTDPLASYVFRPTRTPRRPAIVDPGPSYGP